MLSYSELTPELKLLVLCSATGNEKKRNDINKLINSGINWSMFIKLALQHKVYPLVFQHLRALVHPNVSDKLLKDLYKLKKDNDCKTLQMVTEFSKILQALEQRGISVIVIKGFPLAQQLYGDITLRTSRDIDILISADDIAAARHIMEQYGYQWNHPLANATAGRLKKWMAFNQHLEYWHPERQICIELHWRLDCQSMELPFNLLRKNGVSMHILGREINVLGKEELLLYLILHGAVHRWFRIKWLLDIDIMIRKQNFSWEKLCLLANQLGFMVVLNQAFILARELLGTPLPRDISNRADMDTKAKHLACLALQFIKDNGFASKTTFKTKAIILFKYTRYEFKLKTGWRGQFICIFRYFLPTESDLELVALSERLYFIYYIIAPLSWVYKRTRNVIKMLVKG